MTGAGEGRRGSALGEEEALLLDAVERFLAQDVKPFAHALEQADEYIQRTSSRR